MKEELKEKLGLSRNSSSGYLSPAEREIIARDTELQEELVLNEALRGIDRQEWRQPPRARLLNRVIRSMDKRRRETAVSRLLRKLEEKFPLTPVQLVYRTSLVVVVLLLGMIMINNVGRWAAGPGVAQPADARQVYVLTYDINVPAEVHADAGEIPPGARGLDLVYHEMRGIYFDWSRDHPEFSEAAAREAIVSFRELWVPEPEQTGEPAQVQIELSLGNQQISRSLLDELAMIFDTVPEVDNCVVRRYLRASEEVLLVEELAEEEPAVVVESDDADE